MKKIASFTIDHIRLKRGIFVSRRDTTPSGDVITTFDIRMTEPNRMPPIDGAALHTIEHLAATFLRNHPVWADRVIYWGPMGCCTGNYMIVQGELDSREVVGLLRDTMRFVADFEGEVPGASPKDCGNWSFMDLEAAREAARTYLDEVLTDIKPENLVYPQ